MIQFHSEQGEISVSSAVFSNITGMAATNCYGVKGMAYRSMTDGLVHLLRREAMSKGVSITYHDDNTISIELHIIVEKRREPPCRMPLHHERGALRCHQEYRRARQGSGRVRRLHDPVREEREE